MDKKELNKAINEELALRRQRAELTALARRETAFEHADYADIDRRLRESELSLLRARFNGKNDPDAETEFNVLLKQKTNLEKKYGIDASGPDYTCKNCRDTGYVDGKRCSCAQKIAESILYRICSFASSEQKFSLSTETNPRNKKVISFCGRFADTYPSTTVKSITLSGAVATGKTFLAGCIFNRLVERGIAVLGLTAFELAGEFLCEHTSASSEKSGLFRLIDAPLLIVDDLGSEPFYKNVTCEYMFTLLDARGLKGRGTVLTTNLSLGQLRERYGERVFSRLASKENAICLSLTGADKRMKII